MNTSGLSNRLAGWMFGEPEKIATIDYIMENAQSGDVLLWAAAGSLWTPFWTWSPFSHVSLVYKSPRTGKLYQWQSTTHPEEEDLLTHEYNRNGTQLTPLRESIEHYAKKWGRLIAWRPLMFYDEDQRRYVRDIPEEHRAEIDRGFEATIEKTKGFGFQHDLRDMMGGRDFHLQYCPWPIGRPANFDHKIFCAPLAALTLQEAGVLNVGYPISNYSPASFDYVSHQLFMRENYGYGETVKIAFSQEDRNRAIYKTNYYRNPS